MVLGIYGSGGAGRDILGLIYTTEQENKWDEIVFIDDTKDEGIFMNVKIVPFTVFCERYTPEKTKIIIATGEPAYRELLYNKVKERGFRLETYIHPSSKVSRYAEISEGAVILNDCYVSPMAKIEENTFINGYTIIGHDVRIGKHCQIASQVIVTGNTRVGDCVYIGAGASIRERITIEKYAIISMGAVVLKSVETEMKVMGNPARAIAKNEKHRVF